MKRIVVAALAVAIAATSTSSALAGPLPSWDKRIDKAATRFKVLAQFDDQAVLDKETGLVWQRSPTNTLSDWGSSQSLCVGTPIGGRRGWRLPTAWELMSLSDPSQDNPSLPAGHPFLGISTTDGYWSSTSDAEDPTRALLERFGTGGGGIILQTKTDLARRWCVRAPGGQYGE